MNKIALSPKQQAAAREFDAVIAQLQHQQQSYLKAILDADPNVESDSNWRVAPDYTALVKVMGPQSAV